MVSQRLKRNALVLATFASVGTFLGNIMESGRSATSVKYPKALSSYRQEVVEVSNQLRKAGVPIFSPEVAQEVSTRYNPKYAIHVRKNSNAGFGTVDLERWLTEHPDAIAPELSQRIERLNQRYAGVIGAKNAKYESKVSRAGVRGTKRGMKWGAGIGLAFGSAALGLGAVKRRKQHQMQRRPR